jgi:hypothetical protein
VPTNRKKGITNSKEHCASTPCLQKDFAISKAFGVKWLKTCKFYITSKGELKNE